MFDHQHGTGAEGFLDIFKKPSTVLGGLSTVSRFIPVTKPLSIPLALASQGMKFAGHGVSRGGKKKKSGGFVRPRDPNYRPFPGVVL